MDRLQEEKKAWQAIRKPLLDVPPLFPKGENGPVALPDFDFLDPDEGKIRGLLTDEAASFNAVRTKTESRLGTIQSLLEFQIDQLADAVHKLEQRVFLAGKEADKVLSISALRLRKTRREGEDCRRDEGYACYGGSSWLRQYFAQERRMRTYYLGTYYLGTGHMNFDAPVLVPCMLGP